MSPRIGECELRLPVQVAGKREAGGGGCKRVVLLAQGSGAGPGAPAPLAAYIIGKRRGFAFVQRVAGALRLIVLVDLDGAAVAGIEGGHVGLAIAVNGQLRVAGGGRLVARRGGKERIFPDLVLDIGLKLNSGKLQKLDRLPQLRRDHKLLGLTRLKP